MGACALPGPAAPGSGKEPHSYGNFCLQTGERWRPLQLRPEEEGNRPGPHRPLLASQPRQALPGLSAQGKRPSRFTLMCWFHMTKATYLFEPNFSVCVARGQMLRLPAPSPGVPDAAPHTSTLPGRKRLPGAMAGEVRGSPIFQEEAAPTPRPFPQLATREGGLGGALRSSAAPSTHFLPLRGSAAASPSPQRENLQTFFRFPLPPSSGPHGRREPEASASAQLQTRMALLCPHADPQTDPQTHPQAQPPYPMGLALHRWRTVQT